MSVGHISRQMLEEALSRFHGEILQTPPLYSALKLHGHRIADLTRYDYMQTKGKMLYLHANTLRVLKLSNMGSPKVLGSNLEAS
jgi:tRNA U55 pseudouridine synthase TruB